MLSLVGCDGRIADLGTVTCGDIAKYCATGACVMTLDQAKHTAWCAPDAGVLAGSTVLRPACGGYNTVLVGAFDTSTAYFYDLYSGDLVGVGAYPYAAPPCVAGTIPDVLPYCPDAGEQTLCGP